MFLRFSSYVINFDHIVSIHYREENCSRCFDEENKIYEDYRQSQLRFELSHGKHPFMDINFDTKKQAIEWLDKFCEDPDMDVFYL